MELWSDAAGILLGSYAVSLASSNDHSLSNVPIKKFKFWGITQQQLVSWWRKALQKMTKCGYATNRWQQSSALVLSCLYLTATMYFAMGHYAETDKSLFKLLLMVCKYLQTFKMQHQDQCNNPEHNVGWSPHVASCWDPDNGWDLVHFGSCLMLVLRRDRLQLFVVRLIDATCTNWKII